jgi:hypothetical protein
MISQDQACPTQIVHMPLNGSAADTQNLCDAGERHPGPAGPVVTMVDDAQICRQTVKADAGFPKLRNQVFSFGYPVKFLSPRHNSPSFQVCGGSPCGSMIRIAAVLG